MYRLFAYIIVIMDLPFTFLYPEPINILILIQVHEKNWLDKINVKGDRIRKRKIEKQKLGQREVEKPLISCS